MKKALTYLGWIVLAVAIGYNIYQWFAIQANEREIAAFKAKENKIHKQIDTEATLIKKQVSASGQISEYDIDGKTVPPGKPVFKGKKNIIDTSAMALEIKENQVKSLTQLNAQLTADNLKLSATVDEKNRQIKYYKDPHLAFTIYPPVNPADTSDHGLADVSGKFGLTATQFWRRSGLFGLGKKRDRLGFITDDPRFTISDVHYIGFDQPENAISLSVHAGAGYDIDQRTFNAFPGLRLKVGRMTFDANYKYHFETKRFTKQVSGQYNFKLF
ncbi:hypothetical protein [Pedobacter sp. SYP-B3415]|uniref:hypothetical protein n=1 Tax=Pedobacter sp. SYP-B3415 TaxID=2496641 RepID=UPI00101CF5D8|nr:hypothetical protein [Pedobacter sp. SYP-B3415]